jgi:hypothetical protein
MTEEAFLARVAKDVSGCWLWTGAKSDDGYGVVSTKQHRLVKAHRLAWERAHGAVPRGLYVLHRCDVRLCVNPDHLFIGDHAANMRDAANKGRLNVQIRATELREKRRANASLTVDQVMEIQRSRDTHAALGRRFGVTKGAIWQIRAGRTWKGIA